MTSPYIGPALLFQTKAHHPHNERRGNADVPEWPVKNPRESLYQLNKTKALPLQSNNALICVKTLPVLPFPDC